ALELAALSRRAGGLAPAETLNFGFALADLRQWLSPLFVPLSSFSPAVEWWKCVYVGIAAVAAMLAAVVVLILGGSNPFSRALWLHLPPLRFVRYPGNLAYLAALPLT